MTAFEQTRLEAVTPLDLAGLAVALLDGGRRGRIAGEIVLARDQHQVERRREPRQRGHQQLGRQEAQGLELGIDLDRARPSLAGESQAAVAGLDRHALGSPFGRHGAVGLGELEAQRQLDRHRVVVREADADLPRLGVPHRFVEPG